MAEMAFDNLTDALKRWKDAGVAKPDLAAVTLYKDFWAGALNSDELGDSSTRLIQTVQGSTQQLKCYTKHD